MFCFLLLENQISEEGMKRFIKELRQEFEQRELIMMAKVKSLIAENSTLARNDKF